MYLKEPAQLAVAVDYFIKISGLTVIHVYIATHFTVSLVFPPTDIRYQPRAKF